MTILAWLFARPARLAGAAAVIAIGVLLVRLQVAQHLALKLGEQVREERLGRRNAEARADTTRVLFAGAQDSLRGVTRLAEQLRVQSHSRLEAKNREATARADLEIRFDSLLAHVHTATFEDAAGLRSAELTIDSVPLHVRARVELPPPPGPTRWDVATWLDPASFTLELACEGDRARADLVGPPWLDARLVRVQQVEHLCTPPLQTSAKRRRRLSVGIGAGVAVIKNGPGIEAGPGVFVGVSYRF